MRRPPPTSTLFPYTTLFRSQFFFFFAVEPLRSSASTGNQVLTFPDRKSTRLNSSHRCISYAVFCLKKKKAISHPPLRGVYLVFSSLSCLSYSCPLAPLTPHL